MHFNSSTMTRHSSVQFLLAAVLLAPSAHAQTILGPEFAIPSGEYPCVAERPAVAPIGSGYLAVIREPSPGLGAAYYAVPLDDAGHVSGTQHLIGNAGAIDGATITTLSDHTIVAWSDLSRQVQIRRLDASGSPIDPAPVSIADASTIGSAPAIACNEIECLVAWSIQPTSTTRDLVGTRISASGTALDPAPFTIAASADNEDHVAVAASPTGFMAVWQRWRSGSTATPLGMFARGIANDGTLEGATGTPIADAAFAPRGDNGMPSVARTPVGYVTGWRCEGAVYARALDFGRTRSATPPSAWISRRRFLRAGSIASTTSRCRRRAAPSWPRTQPRTRSR